MPICESRSSSAIVERRVHLPGVDQAPAVAEVVAVDAVDVKAAVAVRTAGWPRR